MAAAARCPPVRFHHIHGANIRMDPSHTQATRVESFANGLCFSQEPLVPGQLFLVEIAEKEAGWCGHLRVGLTAQDPGSLEQVPAYSLPDLVDRGGSWVFAITRNHNRVTPTGDEDRASGRVQQFLSSPYLLIEETRIPRDKLVGRSRPGRYSHILDGLYKANVLPATARRSRIGVLYTLQPNGMANMHIVINGEDMGPSARGLPASRPLYAVVDVFASTKQVQIIQVDYGCRYPASAPTAPPCMSQDCLQARVGRGDGTMNPVLASRHDSFLPLCWCQSGASLPGGCHCTARRGALWPSGLPPTGSTLHVPRCKEAGRVCRQHCSSTKSHSGAGGMCHEKCHGPGPDHSLAAGAEKTPLANRSSTFTGQHTEGTQTAGSGTHSPFSHLLGGGFGGRGLQGEGALSGE